MNLEQFRKMTAHLPGDVQIVIPTQDHSYRPAGAGLAKGVLANDGVEISWYVGEDPELYGLSSNVIVATRTRPVVEVA